MYNRFLAIDFNSHDCLIHLQYDHDKMDVYLLDGTMQDALKTKKFSIVHTGELISDVRLDDKIDMRALIELYDYLLVHPAIMTSIAA